MRHVALIGWMVCLSLCLSVLSVLVADEPRLEPGFVRLVDGSTLDGWEGDKSLWKVENGAIVGDSPGIPKNQFLATTASYGDFELRLEFRLKEGRGNTGVQFRSQRDPKSTEMSGYQADIGEKYWGCLYDEHRRNKILAQAPATLAAALRPDGWNSYTIRADGPRVILSINGVKTVDYVEPDDEIARAGIIALQVHSGPPLRVEFRNIRLKLLKP